jgi:hypothetical protein
MCRFLQPRRTQLVDFYGSAGTISVYNVRLLPPGSAIILATVKLLEAVANAVPAVSALAKASGAMGNE